MDFGQFDNVAPRSSEAKKTKGKRTLKPKRNKSAFILFSKEMRGKVKEQNPHLNPNDQMTKLASLWKELDEKGKEVYHELAKEDKIRYLKELKEFCVNHPIEKIGNKTKKNHVKKACTAYAIFLQQEKRNIKETHPNLRMVEIVKIVAEKWKNIDPLMKEEFGKLAKEEKADKAERFVEFAIERNKKRVSFKRQVNKVKKKIKNIDTNLSKLGVEQEDILTTTPENLDSGHPRKMLKTEAVKEITSPETNTKTKKKTGIRNKNKFLQDLLEFKTTQQGS